MTTLIPLSLYIHFPWCIRKCPYCDFNSHALKQDLPEEDYIKALLADLQQDLSLVQNREIVSIFMGGGTPSLFSPQAIAYLLSQIKQMLPCSPKLEITLEANPGTVEQDRFKGFYQAGINRLSLGIQSFQDDKLKTLGRIHDANAAVRAVLATKQAGFTNFNLDLMFGLPKQEIDDALYDLNTAIALEPTHLSWYQLTLEPNTLFYHQRPTLPADDKIWEMQQQGQALLAKHHYRQYEISAYSREGFPCLHNRNYWEFGDYLGIGAGAHGKITDSNTQQVIRTHKAKHPKDYLDPNRPFIAGQIKVPANELSFEFMLNNLRLKQAVLFNLFEQRTFLAKTVLTASLQKATELLFIEQTRQGFQVTELGWQFLNNLMEIFLP
ncbi:MAG: hemN [Gammaproteobacteria bacterium]|nr:hemN [Gammaproteobacteria bacterium]